MLMAKTNTVSLPGPHHGPAPASIQVAKPRLPDAAALLPYLRQIDRNAWYANHGPLALAFQARLAEHWGVRSQDVALVANATVGLTLLLRASGARPGTVCLMPSWTFVASAGAVEAAGLTPHFVDVCPRTWVPDPADIMALAQRHDVGAILVVSPFGAPLDLAAWDAVQRQTGIPVIIDGAAAFDTLRHDGPMPPGKCPIAVSLHATKVFGVGEGGAVICRDPETMLQIRRFSQFGFSGSRAAMVPGINAKLSEYAAAVGLAGLDEWSVTRANWAAIGRNYISQLPRNVALSPGFGDGWVGSTFSVVWPTLRPKLEAALNAQGVATLHWWGAGCHTQPAYRACRAEPLPVTERLARQTIGLPFWQDLSPAQIDTVCAALARLAGPLPARTPNRKIRVTTHDLAEIGRR
ncbi:MAG: DegT/DnrJ/EryC1/StrS family aminotransferase [Janthinobacterium lividum]